MGNLLSQKIAMNETQFWVQYYQQTGDYSVGPAVTISRHNHVNIKNSENTKRILKKYKVKGGYYVSPLS